MVKREAEGAADACTCQKFFKGFFFPTMRPLQRLKPRKQKPQPPKPATVAGFVEEGHQIMIQSLERPAAMLRAEKPRRNYSLKERAENFIARTRLKLRSGSTVGRHGS